MLSKNNSTYKEPGKCDHLKGGESYDDPDIGITIKDIKTAVTTMTMLYDVKSNMVQMNKRKYRKSKQRERKYFLSRISTWM